MQGIERQPSICLGPYGSGTNFLINTLEKSGAFVTNGNESNEWNRFNKTVFKHYVIEKNSLDILTLPENYKFICIYKHPLYWFKSLQRMVHARIMPAIDMAQLGHLSLSDFIRQPGRMVCVEREIEDSEIYSEKRTHVTYQNLPDFWNQYARGYLHYIPANSIRIAYEHLILEPEKNIEEVICSLNGSCENLVVHKDRRFQNDKEPGHGRNFYEASAFYNQTNSRYEDYSQEDLEFIKKSLDMEAMLSLGYDEF